MFLRAVAAYLERHPEAGAADAVAELARMCDMEWLGRYYSAEWLGSAEAKTGWVEPDLAPIPVQPASPPCAAKIRS